MTQLQPARLIRTYSLRLKNDPDTNRALWRSHYAFNKGTEVFCEWLLTMGGGISPRVLNNVISTPDEKRLVVLTWLTVELGVGEDNKPFVVPAGEDLQNRLKTILAQKDVSDKVEAAEWLEAASPPLSALISKGAQWVDRSLAFDVLCYQLKIKDVEAARADAASLWLHLFRGTVFQSYSSFKTDDDVEIQVDANSTGASKFSSNVFTHLFGSTESFGRPLKSLNYREKWAGYLDARLFEATGGMRPADLEKRPRSKKDKTAHSEGEGDAVKQLVRKKKDPDSRSAGPWLRSMFATAAERVAAYRTKVNSQEKKRAQIYSGIEVDRIENDLGSEVNLSGLETEVQKDLPQINKDRGAQGDEVAAPSELSNTAIRLRVASFRHVDAYKHPVFALFGKDRPTIRFIDGQTDNGKDQELLSEIALTLWDGGVTRSTHVSASSKRLQHDVIKLHDQKQNLTRRTPLAFQAAVASSAEAYSHLADDHQNNESEIEEVNDDQFIVDLTEGVSGRLVGRRRQFASYHGKEEDLNWWLFVSVKLKPQGPWLTFVSKHLTQLDVETDGASGEIRPQPRSDRVARWHGLAYPFKRKDLDVGFGGELSGMPGCRVMGVHLEDEYGGACVLWESITQERYEQLVCKAKENGNSVNETELWTVIKGVGLLRRIGFNQDPAPWALSVRNTIIRLPGEEKNNEKRKLRIEESTGMAQLAKLLSAPFNPAFSFDKNAKILLDHLREAMIENARYRRLISSYGFCSDSDPNESELTIGWRRRDSELWHALTVLTRLLTGTWRNGRGKAKTNKNTKRKFINERGGLSLTRIDLLNELINITVAYGMRSNLGSETPTPKSRLNSRLLYLRDKIANLKSERSRVVANRIVRCALGEGKTREFTFPPAHAIIVENIRSTISKKNRTVKDRRSSQLAPATMLAHLAESCQLHGIHLRVLDPSNFYRMDAKTLRPGVICSEIRPKDFLDSESWRLLIESSKRKIKAGYETPKVRLIVEIFEELKLENNVEQRTVLVPKDDGSLLVTKSEDNGIKKQHLGMNVASHLALGCLTNPQLPSSVWQIPAKWNPRAGVFVSVEKYRGRNLSGWKWKPHPNSQELHIEKHGGSLRSFGIVYFSREVSLDPLNKGQWSYAKEFWNKHEEEVCAAIKGWRG